MSKTPSSVLNSKIRGNKKIDLSVEDYNLFQSLIWTKTEKKVEAIYFEQNKARLSYKNGGRAYFDLENEVIIERTILSIFPSFFFLDNFVQFLIFIIVFYFWYSWYDRYYSFRK